MGLFKKRSWAKRNKTEIQTVIGIMLPIIIRAGGYLLTIVGKSYRYLKDPNYAKAVDRERGKIYNKKLGE
jgi:hypothetical protein